MRRRRQPSDLDSGSERRVVVSVDANTQELVVGGAEGDVDQVAGELEYVSTAYSIDDILSLTHLIAGHWNCARKLLWRSTAYEQTS